MQDPHLVLAVLAAALLVASPVRPTADSQPLIEFTAVDDDAAPEEPPVVADCGYYLQVRGAMGHSGGSRLGASVQLRGDSLFVAIDRYRTSDFDHRDFQRARWTLRVGGLGAKLSVVDVAARPHHIKRTMRLSFGMGSCAA